MKKDNNKNIFIIIGIIALVIVLGIVLVLVTKKEETKPIEKPKEEPYKQCEELKDEKYRDISNWIHNELNYDMDKEGNRTNNSDKIKELHQLDGGYNISEMTIVSKKCSETKAELKAKFTNNSGKDIEFGTINFYFKTSEDAEKEVNVSLDVRDLKNGETKELETSFRFRIIDAYDYRAVFADSSQMEG